MVVSVVSVVSVVRKKFIGQIEFILSRTKSYICPMNFFRTTDTTDTTDTTIWKPGFNLKLPNRDNCVAVLTLRQVSLFREQSSGDIDPSLAHHSLVQGQAIEQGSPSDGFYCQAAHQSLADQIGPLI